MSAASVVPEWVWCDECQAEYGPGHKKMAHTSPGPLRWRQRRWWAWLASQLYVSGAIHGYVSSGHEDGWIVHNLGFGWAARPYVLWLERHRWGAPWHRIRRGHWPERVWLGMCGKCAPWPCCGATGFDHAEGCNGD